jgi:hypothetical protein
LTLAVGANERSEEESLFDFSGCGIERSRGTGHDRQLLGWLHFPIVEFEEFRVIYADVLENPPLWLEHKDELFLDCFCVGHGIFERKVHLYRALVDAPEALDRVQLF